ncbi:MAG TPA: DoxX family protein [Herpetosiphonaceae bacterium]
MLRRLAAYESVAPLLLRIAIGLTFFLAGLSKVMGGTDRVAGFFGSLGIPLPSLMGPFIAYLELLGGLALIVGVLTRLFGLLFVANMVVALLLVAAPKAFAGPNLAVGFNDMRVEWLLLLGSAALALLSPGLFSVDAALLGDRPEPLVEQPRPARQL